MRSIGMMSTIAAVVALAAAPAAAQTTATTTPEQDVMAVVTLMFEGFAKKDTTMIRGTLADDVKLVSAFNNREGKPMVRAETMDKFLAGIASAPGSLDERLFDPEVRIDGNLATVWVKYEFWYDGKYSHCGFDSFQLARGEAGWKIFSIADTRRPKCD
jgi:hypothetical protein